MLGWFFHNHADIMGKPFFIIVYMLLLIEAFAIFIIISRIIYFTFFKFLKKYPLLWGFEVITPIGCIILVSIMAIDIDLIDLINTIFWLPFLIANFKCSDMDYTVEFLVLIYLINIMCTFYHSSIITYIFNMTLNDNCILSDIIVFGVHFILVSFFLYS